MNEVLAYLLPRCALSAAIATVALVVEYLARRRMPSAFAAGVWSVVLLLPFLPALRMPTTRGVIDDGHRALQQALGTDGFADSTASWIGVVSWALLSGAVIAVLRVLLGARSTLARIRPAKLLDRLPTIPERALEYARLRIGLRRTPRVMLTEQDGPAVVGLFSPRILLPRELATHWSEERLQHVFLHECAHLARRDLWRGFLVDLLASVLWFHPVARIARRRLAELREIATDRLAVSVRGATNARAYRRTLLELAQPLSRDPHPVAFGGSAILERLRALEVGETRLRRPSRSLRLGSLLMLLLACTPIPPSPWRALVAREIESPGCLSLRYAVLGALADAESSSIQEPQSDPR